MAQTIKFNVGGEVFEVAQDLIRNSGDNFLSSMLERWSHDASEPHFIDRDAQLFRFLLAWLRDKSIVLPLTASKAAVLKEAEYFNLPIQSSDIHVDTSDLGVLRKRILEVDDQLCSDLKAKRDKKLHESLALSLADLAITAIKGKSTATVWRDSDNQNKGVFVPDWMKQFKWDATPIKDLLSQELAAAGLRLEKAASSYISVSICETCQGSS
eukprot:TRINITY_DN82741_c0_g1_i1.p1 TRINITY_DN82741_c0_g1~~TRINITY_DN82741_c0_g1_i1.p1  ORF type:complete len:212 (+),score=46.42 TRINITY_DN82741_c0_g1_i1:45-680(+)